MKKDWEIKKLGDLSTEKLSYGTSAPSCPYDGKTRYIRITDINDDGELNDDYVTPTKYENKHQLQDGDIVFARTGATVGKAYCYKSTDGICVYAGYLIRLRPNTKIVLPEYILYSTKSKEYDEFIKNSQQAAAQPNVNAEKYSNFEIPLPPLDEQKRIVKLLDEKFATLKILKSNAQKNLTNAKELFQSELSNAFNNSNWEKKRLDEVCEITSSKRIYKDEYVKSGIPFYRTKEIKELAHDEKITLELFIKKEKYLAIKKQFGVPQIGDVLISAVGTIGEILVIENDDPFYFKDGNIIWMRKIKKLNSNFLKYLLQSIVEKLKNMTIGAAYSALTIEKFRECSIPLPTLPEQERIVKHLDSLQEKVRSLEELYNKTLSDCDELKQSYLSKAFSGEL